MKRVLVILGHPRTQSLCGELFDRYETGARLAGAEVQTLVLANLSFNPSLAHTADYNKGVVGALEPDLQRAQQLIAWANHLVWVYPQWWGGVPALLKGFIDRTFLPGFAFKYHKGSDMPQRLLKGKSARLLVTMDAPWWWNRWVYRNAVNDAMQYPILQFCGVRPVQITQFNQVRKAKPRQIQQWLERAQRLGALDGGLLKTHSHYSRG